MPDLAVVAMTDAHQAGVLAAYAEGIATGDATFETAVPSWSDFLAGKLPDQCWVAVAGSSVLGWTACSPVSSRCVYSGVVEHSVYVAEAARGRGVGAALLQRLIDSTEAAGIWTVQSGIFPENGSSLRLHAALGFRVVGVRERLGRAADGRWRDVVLVERRSPVL